MPILKRGTLIRFDQRSSFVSRLYFVTVSFTFETYYMAIPVQRTNT